MADLPNIDFNRIEIPKFPKLPLGGLKAIITGLAVVLTALSTLYQVQPEEVGVVLRFGQYVRTTEPGLRAKLPFVEEVRKFRFSVNSSRSSASGRLRPVFRLCTPTQTLTLLARRLC